MPIFDFKCKSCGTVERDILVSKQDPTPQLCTGCGDDMDKIFPKSVHTKVGTSVDGKDVGKVVQQKNEQLKKQYGGYSYEEQNMRKHVESMAIDRMNKDK